MTTYPAETKKELDSMVLMWVVQSMRPFSIMEDEGLQVLISKLSSRKYQLPSRKYLSNSVPDLYLSVQEKVPSPFDHHH
jgi:hypothetical protein